MANTELQFEMAMRDQIIHNQREAQRKLWNLLMGLGLNEKEILEIAAKQGVTIENWSSDRKQSPSFACGGCTPFRNGHFTGQMYSGSSCSSQSYQDFGSRSLSREHLDPTLTFLKEEHDSSYLLNHDQSPLSNVDVRKSCDSWFGGRPGSWPGIPDLCSQSLQNSFPGMRIKSSPQNTSYIFASHSVDFR